MSWIVFGIEGGGAGELPREGFLATLLELGLGLGQARPAVCFTSRPVRAGSHSMRTDNLWKLRLEVSTYQPKQVSASPEPGAGKGTQPLSFVGDTATRSQKGCSEREASRDILIEVCRVKQDKL